MDDKTSSNTQISRVDRLISAYEAGCRMAEKIRTRFDEQRCREEALQQGYSEREEINCFVAALRNHC